jgi:hypothetical protein
MVPNNGDSSALMLMSLLDGDCLTTPHGGNQLTCPIGHYIASGWITKKILPSTAPLLLCEVSESLPSDALLVY